MKIVIDTDVLIALVKARKLEDFLIRYEPYITIITLYEYVRGEVAIGIEVDESKKSLEEAFNVLLLDNDAIKVASVIWSKLKSKGLLIDDRDLLIGAICISNNLPLWTLNKEHFERLTDFGLKMRDIDINSI